MFCSEQPKIITAVFRALVIIPLTKFHKILKDDGVKFQKSRSICRGMPLGSKDMLFLSPASVGWESPRIAPTQRCYVYGGL